MVGVGILLDNGEMEETYARSLGMTTHNQAKRYTLFLGPNLFISIDIPNMLIIGDSLPVIL